MAMVSVFLLAALSQTNPPTGAETAVTPPPAKTEDCGADKTGQALAAPPTAEVKAAEDKALEQLGLKQAEVKKVGTVPAVKPATGMETCQ